MNEEFVFNIWFIVDIGTDLSTDCMIRPYNLTGSDEDKLKVLHILAENDYKSCERIRYSESLNVNYGDGKALQGVTHKDMIKSYFEMNFEFFAQQVEKQLPILFRFEGDGKGRNEKIKQSLPQNPLYVLTMLFENQYGEWKPYTTTENIAWIESERKKLKKHVAPN